MQVEEFRYVITPVFQSQSSYNQIVAELPFTGVSFSQQLNSVGTFQGHVLLSGLNTTALNVYDSTVPGQHILWVIYTDPFGNTTPVWSGIIWGRDYDSVSQTLSISAQEMMSLYNRRLISTTKDYSTNPSDPLGYDPAYIAYQLMTYAEGLQHGNTGLTQNSATTTYRTKKKYEGYQLKSVYQAIKDLSANFFDFAIKPYLDGSGNLYNKFTIGTNGPHGGFLGSVYDANSYILPVFQFPGNLVGYHFPEDASAAANKLYGLGYGDNTSRIGAIAKDADKINTYNVSYATGTGTAVTYTVNFTTASHFTVGTKIQVYDVTPSQYNGTFVITGITSTTFTVASTATGVYLTGGKAVGLWPLLESTANYTDVADVQLLKDLTLGQLEATSYPPTTIQIILPPYIDPVFTSYHIGDEVRLDIRDDYFPNGISFGGDAQPLRIMAINVQPGENGPARVTLTLTRQLAAGEVS